MKTPTLFPIHAFIKVFSSLRRGPVPVLALPVLLLLSLGSISAASYPILTFGGPGVERAEDIAVDTAGNTYILGSFQDTVDFDPGSGTVEKTATSTDLFVASYTDSGSLRFVITIENPFNLDNSILGSAITADEAGNFYITGRFAGMIDFDPGPETETRTAHENGLSDVFVARYSPTGSLVYVLSYGAPQTDSATDIAVDAAGNVYVSGVVLSISGETLDFDPGPGTAEHTPDGNDSYLVSYDANGAFRFVTTFGGAGVGNDAYATDFVFGDAGVIYLAGYFDGTVDFDPGPDTEERTSNGEFLKFDGFVASYSMTEGHFESVFAYGGEGEVFVNQLARDDAGNLYVAGSIEGTADFDPGPGTETHSGDGPFLVGYGTNGTLRFVNSFNSDDMRGVRIAVDGAGDIFLTGFFNDPVDFDPGPDSEEHTPTGDDTFIARYNANGAFCSVATFDGGPNLAAGIALDGSGTVYVTGRFQRTVDFDPGEGIDEHTANGVDDIFVVSLTDTGTCPLQPAPPPAETLHLPFVTR